MTLATATPARAPVEEIRLAVVLNGGVSLAVWMGGVVQELDRLPRRGHQRRGAGSLLRKPFRGQPTSLLQATSSSSSSSTSR